MDPPCEFDGFASKLTRQGIGALSSTPLRHLNLGRNQLKSLPAELGKVGALKS